MGLRTFLGLKRHSTVRSASALLPRLTTRLTPSGRQASPVGHYALLRQEQVQRFLRELAATRNIVFVTGCARSGTTLLQRCLATLHDPIYYWSENSLTAIFKSRRIDGANIVLKRTAACHSHFDAIPTGIKIVHIVRHPAHVFTSRHAKREGFYVTPQRWQAEYAAFTALRERHPHDRLTVVRYEDLLAEPDAVQDHIGRALDVSFDLPFSRYTERDYLDEKIVPHTGLKRTWVPIDPGRPQQNRTGTEHITHWAAIRTKLAPELARFCEEFGYPIDRAGM